MPETLNYLPPAIASPTPAERIRHWIVFWGSFVLTGAVSVPACELAVSLHYHEQELFSVGGLILTATFWLAAGMPLAFAHTLFPRRCSSSWLAVAFAVLGPVAGLALFCRLVA